MKKMTFCTLLVWVMFVLCGISFAASSEFNSFYKKIGQAVKSNNKKAIMNLMSDEFLMPGYEKVAKIDALTRMDQEKILPIFKKALNTKIVPLSDTGCDVKDTCYSVWEKDPAMGFIFKLNNGKWFWTEWRAQ